MYAMAGNRNDRFVWNQLYPVFHWLFCLWEEEANVKEK